MYQCKYKVKMIPTDDYGLYLNGKLIKVCCTRREAEEAREAALKEELKMVKTGDFFKVADKTGREYTYSFLGINPDDSGREVILRNHTLNETTRVEMEWFRQRTIITMD